MSANRKLTMQLFTEKVPNCKVLIKVFLILSDEFKRKQEPSEGQW